MAEERSVYLCEALEECILVCLPVKSIRRFESVCRRWRSMLRSEAFMELYDRRHLGGDDGAELPRRKDLYLMYPQLVGKESKRKRQRAVMSVIGPFSNGGIYALTSVRAAKYKNVYLRTLKIALFNPVTLELKLTPPIPDEYRPLITGISSRPCILSCSLDDDYRTVVLINYGGVRVIRKCVLVFFYTPQTGEWERLVDYKPGKRSIGQTDVFKSAMGRELTSVFGIMMTCSQKLFNGCWNWMTSHMGVNLYYLGVLSFNFRTKSFGLVPGPPSPRFCLLSADVFVLQDHLAAILLYKLDFELQIWMRRPDNQTWTVVYHVHPNLQLVSYRTTLHDIEYQIQEQQQKEEELIKIKSLTLHVTVCRGYRRLIFDENGGHHLANKLPLSDQISLSVGGCSTFRPTFKSIC